MIIVFNDKHKTDLKALTKLSAEHVASFCTLALDFIRKGANKKAFASAAQSLGISVEDVQALVESLSYLFSESSKTMVSEIDFLDSLIDLQLSEELRQTLLTTYQENCKEVRTILGQMSVKLPRYNDLDWRLNVDLASRSLRGQADPSFTVKLSTVPAGRLPEDGVSTQLFQADLANITHLCDTLEVALREGRSAHTRRVGRQIK